EIERQDLNAVVLPFAGVFAKHDAPGRHVVGTPSHAVFIRADTPYRVGFPGAVGDRAIVLRFDDSLVPEEVDCRRGSETMGSHGLLSADAMIRRDLLRRRLMDAATDPFEIETLGLALLDRCLRVLRVETVSATSAAHLRRMRAVARVKEAVAVAPAETW